MRVKVYLFTAAALILAICPMSAAGQSVSAENDDIGTELPVAFEARVIEVLEEASLEREGGPDTVQQDLLLEGIDGEFAGKRFVYEGISDIDVVSAQRYSKGDVVLAQRTIGPDGEENFVIIDFVRRGYLYLLGLIFAVVSVAIGGRKGLRALLALLISFVVIVRLILPGILAGHNPLLVGLLGALAILAFIIYLTEGWRVKSHVGVASVFLALLVTLFLSSLFTYLTRLSGMAMEEATFLLDAAGSVIDFRGLLLTGMLIGTIGVLDDIIIGQVEAVQQIKEANPDLGSRRVFVAAYKVGNAHFGAIINTLFLTYAGASLPLLLLFSVGQEPFVTFGAVLNNELIATEIVRALVGSIGVAVAMPISTALACRFLSARKMPPVRPAIHSSAESIGLDR